MGHFIMFDLNLVNVVTSKLTNNVCPYYLNEVFGNVKYLIELRSSLTNLKYPFSKLTFGAKVFHTMIDPSQWENLLDTVKKATF